MASRNSTPIDFKEAVRQIAASRRVVITTHARADADAIGCVAALQRVLRADGRAATGLVHEPLPPPYAFMGQAEPIGIWEPARAAELLKSSDLLVIVDTCARAQLGEVAGTLESSPIRKIAIDHHQTRDDIVDCYLIDPSAGACGQLITQLCDTAGWPIDPVTAMLLFTAIATDSGWFRFSNADRALYATAARLIEAGARPNELYERIYLNESLPRARLMGAVLSGFELHADGRLAVIRLSRQTLQQCGARPEMTENLINEPQRVGSVIAAVMLVEPFDDGPIRVSLRSKHTIDVAKIASAFGGGGHTRAAGLRMNGTLDEVARQVVPIVQAAIEAVRIPQA